jgi:hypothetical protein
MEQLTRTDRLFRLGGNIDLKGYADDFQIIQIENSRTDAPPAFVRRYVVETATKFIERRLAQGARQYSRASCRAAWPPSRTCARRSTRSGGLGSTRETVHLGDDNAVARRGAKHFPILLERR